MTQHWGCRILVALAAIGIVLPERAPLAAAPNTRPAVAPEPAATAMTRIRDVALTEEGILHGVVVDSQAAVVASVPVVVTQGDRELARTLSNEEGRFAISGMRGGVYQISAGNGVAAYRVWTARTAPPSATQIALINSQSQVVRGQMPFWDLFRTDVFLIGAIVATAVAIPVIVHNNRDDDDSTS